jgi:tetratricopeptide (TPR) repeat protein
MSADPSHLLLARDRDALENVLRRGSGRLEETPYPILLLAMALSERSGVLQLQRNQLQKSVVFDDGSPVECRSNIATEMLGRYLVSNGKVSEYQCHAAFSVATSRGVPLGEILTERKLISSTELYRALQQNLGRKLLEPFSWKNGTWELSGAVPPIGSALRVRVPQLLVTGILKVEPQESADAAVSQAYGKYLSLSDSPLFGLDHLRPTPDQNKVLDAARKGTAFDELRDSAGIDTDDLHRILYALLLLGILTVTDQPPVPQLTPSLELVNPFIDEPLVVDLADAAVSQPAPTPVFFQPAASSAPMPAWQLPTAITAPPGTEPASAEEVMAAFLSYRRKDAFELLGLGEADPPPALAAAFLKIADQFLPSKFDAAAADGLRDKAREVLLAAAKAFAELSDPGRREDLVKKRESLRQHEAVAQAGQATMIDPEALCQSGRALAAGGKLREALSSFEMAAECDAQNGTYAAEAAWCRFRLNATPATNALKLLKNAVRIDAKSGVAYLYAGQVQAVLGNRLEAQAYMSRAATLLPGDPRPAAALKASGFPAT